ncbi:MAG: zf-HC2 domain-containing protein [Candidatus Latescibacteria bacterium]|nr:zf-HC2 domain-containing protein [Candidatus Latescibacterota bacterium]
MSSVCERRDQLLTGLLYEEGDPQELAEARAHLATCSDCRREYEALIESRELLGSWPNVANVPRLVYVSEPISFLTRVRRWVDEMGSLRLRSLLRPAVAAASAIVVIVIAISVLRFQVGPDGVLEVGFGRAAMEKSPALTAIAEDTAGGPAASEAARPISREEFTRGMENMAAYINELVRNTRMQDRQVLMATLEQQLNERDAAITGTVLTALNNAFGQMDQYGQRLDVLTAAFQDLYDITGTELQKTNAILAALLQQSGFQERK